MSQAPIRGQATEVTDICLAAEGLLILPSDRQLCALEVSPAITDFSPKNADGGACQPRVSSATGSRWTTVHRRRLAGHIQALEQDQGSNSPFNPSHLGAVGQATNFSALEFFSIYKRVH